jgi:hypothetical protein
LGYRIFSFSNSSSLFGKAFALYNKYTSVSPSPELRPEPAPRVPVAVSGSQRTVFSFAIPPDGFYLVRFQALDGGASAINGK